jgi:hypothetical protein
MERVDVDAVERVPDSASVKRPLSRALGATNLALVRYELAPGDSFAYGYHRHSSQGNRGEDDWQVEGVGDRIRCRSAAHW